MPKSSKGDLSKESNLKKDFGSQDGSSDGLSKVGLSLVR